MDVVDAQDVVAGAAGQAVRVGAAIEEVIARPALQAITPLLAKEAVIAAASEQSIVAGAAEQLVLSGTAQEVVVARAPEQLIVAGAAVQEVIALVAMDDVVAGPAEQPIVVRRAVDHIVAVGPGNGGSDAPAGLHAIDHIGAAAEPRLLQRPAGAKGDADVSRHDRVAITASRCPVWWRERSSDRGIARRGQCCRRFGGNRIEDLPAGRSEYRALQPFRRQLPAGSLARVY